MPSGLWHFALSVGVCSLSDNNNNNNNYSRTIQPTIARKKIARDKSIPLRLYGLNYSRTIQRTIAKKKRRSDRRREKDRERDRKREREREREMLVRERRERGE